MDSDSSSCYLLRWSDHLSNYAEMFMNLREKEEFLDCSIACDDGVVGAHRVVLAGCSAYLRDLLKFSKNPHPIIFLVNISRSTVLLLLEFIYRGQVHIPYSQLDQLVALGRSMQVKGLSQIQLPNKSSPNHLNDLPIYNSLNSVEISDDHVNESSDGGDKSPEKSIEAYKIVEKESSFLSKKNTPYTFHKSVEEPPVKEQSPSKPQESEDVRKQSPSKPQESEDVGKRVGEKRQNSVPLSSSDTLKSKSLPSAKRLKVSKNPENGSYPAKNGPRTELERSLHYVPKPKSKQNLKFEESSSSSKRPSVTPIKAKEVKSKISLEMKVVKPKTKGKKRGRPPGSTTSKKVKQPIFKIKKNPSLKRIQTEPKYRLYNKLEAQIELGAVAKKNGLYACQRYALSKYGIKVRVKSIEKMMSLVTSQFKDEAATKKETPKK